MPLTRGDGVAVPTRRTLAEDRVAEKARLTREETARLREYTVAAKGGSSTFKDMKTELWKAATDVTPGLPRKAPTDL